MAMVEHLDAPLYWEANYEIVLALRERYPHVLLEELGIEELHRMIVTLPQFADEPNLGNEAILQAILCEWYEEIVDG